MNQARNWSIKPPTERAPSEPLRRIVAAGGSALVLGLALGTLFQSTAALSCPGPCEVGFASFRVTNLRLEGEQGAPDELMAEMQEIVLGDVAHAERLFVEVPLGGEWPRHVALGTVMIALEEPNDG